MPDNQTRARCLLYPPAIGRERRRKRRRERRRERRIILDLFHTSSVVGKGRRAEFPIKTNRERYILYSEPGSAKGVCVCVAVCVCALLQGEGPPQPNRLSHSSPFIADNPPLWMAQSASLTRNMHTLARRHMDIGQRNTHVRPHLKRKQSDTDTHTHNET